MLPSISSSLFSFPLPHHLPQPTPYPSNFYVVNHKRFTGCQQISKKDLKNLRLTHPFLAAGLAPNLFTEIKLKFTTEVEYQFKEVDLGRDKKNKDNSKKNQDKKNKREKYKEKNKDKQEALLKLGQEQEEINSKAKDERTPLKDRIKALKKKEYQDSFTHVVRCLRLDIPEDSNLDAYLEEFAAKKYNVKVLQVWFPNLKEVHLRANVKSNTFLAIKLMKALFEKTTEGVSLCLELEGYNRTCLKQIKNLNCLTIRGDHPMRDDTALYTALANAINLSPDLSRLCLDVNSSHWARDTFDLAAFLQKVSDDRLTNLKVLQFSSYVGSNDAAVLGRLRSLEELSFAGSKSFHRRTWYSYSPPNTGKEGMLWEYMATHGVMPKTLRTQTIHASALNYLGGPCASNLTSLTIRADSNHPKEDMKNLEEKFWNLTMSKLKQTLLMLNVTSKVFYIRSNDDVDTADLSGDTGYAHSNGRYIFHSDNASKLFLTLPFESGELDQNFSELETIEVPIELRDGALGNVLSFFLAADNAKRLTVAVRIMDYSYDSSATLRLVNSAKEKVDEEVADWSSDNFENGHTFYKDGTVLTVNVYDKHSEDLRPASSIKFVSRKGKWHAAV